jgi:hypothetical protein
LLRSWPLDMTAVVAPASVRVIVTFCSMAIVLSPRDVAKLTFRCMSHCALSLHLRVMDAHTEMPMAVSGAGPTPPKHRRSGTATDLNCVVAQGPHGSGLTSAVPEQNILGPATMRRLVFFQPLFRRTIANREQAAEADSVVRAIAIVAIRKSVSVDVHKAPCGRGGVSEHSIAVAVITTAFCAPLRRPPSPSPCTASASSTSSSRRRASRSPVASYTPSAPACSIRHSQSTPAQCDFVARG